MSSTGYRDRLAALEKEVYDQKAPAWNLSYVMYLLFAVVVAVTLWYTNPYLLTTGKSHKKHKRTRSMAKFGTTWLLVTVVLCAGWYLYTKK